MVGENERDIKRTISGNATVRRNCSYLIVSTALPELAAVKNSDEASGTISCWL